MCERERERKNVRVGEKKKKECERGKEKRNNVREEKRWERERKKKECKNQRKIICKEWLYRSDPVYWYSKPNKNLDLLQYTQQCPAITGEKEQ